MTDFGNNRIVRYVPGAATETYWTLVDPAFAILNPAESSFDDAGAPVDRPASAGRMERFDPPTTTLTSYFGFLNPIHFDFFRGRLYVAEAIGANGRSRSSIPGSRLAIRCADAEPQTVDVGEVARPERRSGPLLDRRSRRRSRRPPDADPADR